MKKTGLKAACLLLIWVLLWAATGLAMAEEEAPVEEAASGLRNIIVLPYTNAPNLYSNADPENRFLDTFSGLFQLLPDDGSVLYSVCAMDANNDVITVSSPADVQISLERVMNARQADQIRRIKNLELKENDLLFILDCSGDYDASEWRGLAELIDNGVHICFIEIQNERNQNKKDGFVRGLSLTEIIPNQFQEIGNISFCWMDNMVNPLDILLPMMQSLTDSEYMKVNLNEDSIFEILPLVSLTTKTRLLLQWADSLAENGINSVQTESAGELVYGNSAFAIIDILKGTSHIAVPASAANSVYFLTEEIGTDQIALAISKTTDKVFSRNQQNIYEVSLQGSTVDASAIAADLQSHGLQMTLKREEDSSFSVPMIWFEDQQKWTATVTYNQGGTWTMYAEADLGGDRIIKSGPETVTVENHPPVVGLDGSLLSESGLPVGSADNPIRIWVNNPWDESTKEMVSIPLQIKDDDNDTMTLFANGETEHFVTNLGKVSFSEIVNGSARMIITLNAVEGEQQIEIDTPFTITVQGSDGQDDSVPVEITFMLQDLNNALRQVTVSDIVSGDPQAKKQDFDVFFTVDTSACSDPSRVLAVLKDHAEYRLVLSEDELVPMTLKEDGNEYHATLRVNDPGRQTLTVTETMQLPVPASKTIQIQGSSPDVRKRLQNLEDEIENDGDVLKWDSAVFLGQNIFEDADKDAFTVTVSITDGDNHPYTLKPVENGTGPIIYEVKSGKPDTPVEISSEQSFKLRFMEEGNFTVKFTAKDVDGESDQVSMNIQLVTRWNKILGYVKKYAPYAAAAILLILILTYLLKPSFKGKTVHMTMTNADMEQMMEIPLNEWKKSKKPFWQLLTCAAFPPEPELFEKISKVQVKPARRGIIILKASELTGRKRVVVDDRHPLNCQLGDVNLTITVK